jgi:osmotically-inducible protein OsmY
MKRWLGLGYVVALMFTAACARTDTGITTAVKTKLAADETVKAYQVNVDTHDHIVTLSGKGRALLQSAPERAVTLEQRVA